MEKESSDLTVAIVTDANSSIGMGHAVRCGAIASSLKKIGISVFFIVSDKESLQKMAQLGHPVLSLNSEYKSIAAEGKKIIALLKEHSAGFVFFDSYFASDSLFETVSVQCPVGCFGYGKNYKSGMSLIVPYGVSSDAQWYRENFSPEKTAVLFGSDYVPLRESFGNDFRTRGNAVPKNLLLTCGATDPLGIIPALINSIRTRDLGITIHAVIGQFFDIEELSGLSLDTDGVVLHEGVSDLSSVMSDADIAVSAGGMTLYELMASGVPTVAFSMADNQLGNSRLDGAVLWCGDIRRGGALDPSKVSMITDKVSFLIKDAAKRAELIQAGRNMCDGRGADRIAESIYVIMKRHSIQCWSL